MADEPRTYERSLTLDLTLITLMGCILAVLLVFCKDFCCQEKRKTVRSDIPPAVEKELEVLAAGILGGLQSANPDQIAGLLTGSSKKVLLEALAVCDSPAGHDLTRQQVVRKVFGILNPNWVLHRVEVEDRDSYLLVFLDRPTAPEQVPLDAKQAEVMARREDGVWRVEADWGFREWTQIFTNAIKQGDEERRKIRSALEGASSAASTATAKPLPQ